MWQNSQAACAAYLIRATVRWPSFHYDISIYSLYLEKKQAHSYLLRMFALWMHICLFFYSKNLYKSWKTGISWWFTLHYVQCVFPALTSACPRAVKRQRISLNTPTASFLVLIWHEQSSSRARPSTAWSTEQWGLLSGSLGLDWWREKTATEEELIQVTNDNISLKSQDQITEHVVCALWGHQLLFN